VAVVESFAQISNRRIGYTDVGSGPTVLLLHGDTDNRTSWTARSSVLDDLAADYRVVAPDTRGNGKSPDTRGPFSYEDFADDWRILIDELGLGRVAVIGLSGGACTALLMGLSYPEEIRGMVLAGCPYNISNYRDGLLESFENFAFEDFVAQAGDWVRTAAAAYDDIADYATFMTRMITEHQVRQPNLTLRDLGRITPRSLVIHAENEQFFDQVHSEDLARTLPDADLLIAPGADHGTIFTHDPEWIMTRIRAFLSTLD
jgi:pimeloyl-ACP methyl ester carboxylesterase